MIQTQQTVVVWSAVLLRRPNRLGPDGGVNHLYLVCYCCMCTFESPCLFCRKYRRRADSEVTQHHGVRAAKHNVPDDGSKKYESAKRSHKYTYSSNMVWHTCSMINYDTCLLYTSPSPRDKRQSRMPSSA